MFSQSHAAHADQVPRSGYRGSDFVRWHGAEIFHAAAGLSGYRIT
jgi:hypothetical protein